MVKRSGRPKNRMPELGSSGSVRGEGSNALTYSEMGLSMNLTHPPPSLPLEGGGTGVLAGVR